MHVRALAVLVVLGLSSGGAAAVACGGGVPPENLLVPASLHSTLRAVFLKAHPGLRSDDVTGPLPGRTYYGKQGDFHAVATFQVGGHPAYPSTFWRSAGRPWRFS